MFLLKQWTDWMTQNFELSTMHLATFNLLTHHLIIGDTHTHVYNLREC